jgi:hypothetical protein
MRTTSSKEVGSKLVDKFNSQSYETSISFTSPESELSTSPPSSCLVELLVPVFPTSSGQTLSSVFMSHFGHFYDGPGFSDGVAFPSRFILSILSITSSN